MKKVYLIVICLVIITLAFLSQPPKDFPSKQFDFHIKKGESLSAIADDLYNQKIISSRLFFKVFSVVMSRNKGVQAGDYRFIKKENAITVTYRLIKGDQRQPKVRITIFEGTNVSDMAFIYLTKLSDFNAARFVSLAKKDEGYLYPDTYNFLANAKPEEIIKTMKDNFKEKTKNLTLTRPLKEIVTMASIIEKEANNQEDRRIIAGILWKRLDEGMLLQVDPVFYYITGKLGNVTYDDLKVDSPYNTYKYKGLPKGPITNPGIEAIQATLNPIKTKYYFYLTGRDGKMYYSTTYDGHLKNKSLYLK